jgi:putative transposase
MVEDPAHYRWSSFRTNGLGQADALISSHPLYLALGSTAAARADAYRVLFRAHLEQCAIDDIRLALNQNQPLGNSRFYSKIARMMGERRQARPRGRPRAEKAPGPEDGQGKLGF